MRRIVLLGVLAALPLVVVPLVWAATGGSDSRDAALADFRDVSRSAPVKPARPVESVVATPTRVSFLVTAGTGAEVTIRDGRGRLVRRLGHFTAPARQRLVLAWDGRDLAAGRYVAVVLARGQSARAPFQVRRLPDADDAGRESLREPGDA